MHALWSYGMDKIRVNGTNRVSDPSYLCTLLPANPQLAANSHRLRFARNPDILHLFRRSEDYFNGA